MKTVATVTAAFLAIGGCALASWSTAAGRGLFPYYMTGGDWYTLLTFVNGSEETGDVLHVRFIDIHSSSCSDTLADMFSIRQREMLIFSTTPQVPNWIPVSGRYDYIKFRVQGGGFIHAYCVIYNQVNGSGYIVPAYHQDSGF